MKKNILLIFTILTSSCFSQNVGINSTGTSPANCAALDVDVANKGLLIPRVSLTTTLLFAPVTGTPVTSLLVYNTATAGTSPNNVTPGYYYWNGTRWIRIDDSSTSSSSNVYSGTAVNSTPVEPNLGDTWVFSNATNGNVNNTGVTRNIVVSGVTGTISNIQVKMRFWSNDCPNDVEIFLRSPANKIIRLKANGTGGCTQAGNQTIFDVDFSDYGSTNTIPFIPSGTTLNGLYKPEGSIVTSTTPAPSITSTISTFSGYIGDNPNGTWGLIFKDVALQDIATYDICELTITTNKPTTYICVGQTVIPYSAVGKIEVTSNFSADCLKKYGFITALTRSTTSVPNGTSVTNLPGTILSYASDSPGDASPNYFASAANNYYDSGLTIGTTYYYQLWVKGAVFNQAFSLFSKFLP